MYYIRPARSPFQYVFESISLSHGTLLMMDVLECIKPKSETHTKRSTQRDCCKSLPKCGRLHNQDSDCSVIVGIYTNSEH